MYPVMLQIANKPVVVVGGGDVAERKVVGLLEANAAVTVVSPAVTKALKELAENGKIHWKEKLFSADDIDGAFLVIAATNDRHVNETVAQVAKPHQLINIVDDPERSNFHVPSVVRRGKLTISVSTNGASPTLAKQIRNEIANIYDEEYERYVDFLLACRRYILQHIDDASIRRSIFQTIATESFRKNGTWEEQLRELIARYKKQP
ncbi:NAD(P)-binding protein [Anoxybacteroides amylolyticum]|uniref:precorrin-2 dehydrogenase n=1 Tax=Anoxybacteroides amylolyticum TaxID=294699 RepID=A0A160F1V5_9BACL|nr:NAD(P)-binding protein [Anoxybacillus amylolyticus]ANB59575.1 hypothetical protein GFC30_822 [Anoxybacillus amylolyticus]